MQSRLFSFPFVSRRHLLVAGAVLAVMAGGVAPARAQSAENVAIVINDNSPDSQRIGEYYAKARSLPPGNILRIPHGRGRHDRSQHVCADDRAAAVERDHSRANCRTASSISC